MENKKIFLVAKGAYSDYHIIGAEETRENAEKFIESVNSGLYNDSFSDEFSIEEIEIGRYNSLKLFEVQLVIYHKNSTDRLGYLRYDVENKNIQDGEELWTCDLVDYPIYGIDEFFVWDDGQGSYSWTFYIEAKDTKAALKIAHERIGMIKARPDFDKILECDKLLHWPSCTV